MLDDGYVWAWGYLHGNSPARVDAYGADTAMRLHGSWFGGSAFVVLADGTATRIQDPVELGGGIVEIAHTFGHFLVLKDEP